MPTLTPQSSAQKLTALNASMTWREISTLIEANSGIHVPPGTLATFAKSGGQYVPHKRPYRIALGLTAPAICETPARLLAWQFEHRETF